MTDSGLLEIKRQDGSLQNYFEYSAATDRFICTNHPKAIGFKNQTIFRDAAMGPIERDVWLSDAIFRAFLGRWERPAVDLSGPGIGLEANQRLHDLITKDFRQLCFEGKLPVWAKSRGTDLWMSVRPSFWKDHRINYLTIMNTSPDKLLVERESDGVTVSDMSEWMTSRAKVDTLWPVGG